MDGQPLGSSYSKAPLRATAAKAVRLLTQAKRCLRSASKNFSCCHHTGKRRFETSWKTRKRQSGWRGLAVGGSSSFPSAVLVGERAGYLP